ncbi:Acidic nucleoplasmic DNA-binding protein 1 [Intoshia linei]|uniref:Acidic nucleoplasmic DNA-binding protein 1 n=1 Tax=Intoshia linei TaxID=1819745 RepID=A0A177AWP8_9BILA|nr:Acidic nucleoplasmic DNA-binding protein 1 [Intoshia linei]
MFCAEKKYCHDIGYTHLDVCPSENFFMTSGIEGDIRVWKSFDDETPESYRGGECVTCVACGEDTMYIGCSDGVVSSREISTGLSYKTIVEFSDAPTDITLSKSGTLLATGSRNFKIILVNLENMQQYTFDDCNGAVLSLCFSLDDLHMAATSCDGFCRIWKVGQFNDFKSFQLVKLIHNVVEKINSFSKFTSICGMSWNNNNKEIVIPVKSKLCVYSFIERFDTNDLDEMNPTEFVDELKCNTSKILSSCIFFDSFKKIVAISTEGDAFIWNFLSGKFIQKILNPNSAGLVCCTRFNSSINQIIMTTMTGHMNSFNLCGFKDEVINADSSNIPLYDDTIFKRKLHFSDSDCSMDVEEPVKRVKYSSDINEYVEKLDCNHICDINVNTKKKTIRIGSTELVDGSQYMVWNWIGTVRRYVTKVSEGVDENLKNSADPFISVEFREKSHNHSLQISDLADYTMSALSSTVCVVASGDESNSILKCCAYKSWDQCKNSKIEMHPGEIITNVAASDRFIAYTTNKNLLHFYSIGLNSIVAPIYVPGVIIFTVASSITTNLKPTKLVLITDVSDPINCHRMYEMFIYKVDVYSVNLVEKSHLPLNNDVEIDWIGFSMEGNLFFVNSDGYLFNYIDGIWSLLFNINRTCRKGEKFWIIAIFEEKSQVRAILCKNGTKYPPSRAITLPIVETIPFYQSEICDNEKQENLLSNSYLICNAIPILNLKKSAIIMRRFAFCAKSGYLVRALENVYLMKTEKELNLALKYANHVSQPLFKRIQHFINSLKSNLANLNDSQLTKFENIFNQSSKHIKPINNKTKFNIGTPSQPQKILQNNPIENKNTESQNLDKFNDWMKKNLNDLEKEFNLKENDDGFMLKAICKYKKSTQ